MDLKLTAKRMTRMKRTFIILLFIVSALSVGTAYGQQDDEAARDRHAEGWAGCLDKLEHYLA